jgi:predicted AlkP superfamily phosphohydrolase/phosphomutase
MPAEKDRKLYIIGIDAAPLWIIRNYLKKADLEGFSEIMKEGALIDMESTLPPMTGPSWPSIYTGFRPGQHGVPEFLKMEPDYTRSVVYYDPGIKPPFWESIAQKGFRSLVMTPAMLVRTPTSRNIDMITGFPLPPKFSSNSIKEAADRHDFKGEPEIEAEMKNGELPIEEASNIYKEGIRKRAEVSKDLMDANDYNLSFICFTETDRMQHFSLNKKNWASCVVPLYEEISKFLKWTERRAKKEGATVMVISDHGAQPIKKMFLMNGWLMKEGYSKFKKEIEEGLNERSQGMAIKYKLREQILRSVHRSGSRKAIYDKLPRVGKRMARAILANSLSGTSGVNYNRIHDFDYEMSKTKAFANIANCPVTTIYINDGRFTHGSVKAAEKLALKKRIMRDLMNIKDEKGKPLIINVWDGDEYYEGTKLFIAPDIMAQAEEGYLLESFGFLKDGNLFMEPEMPKSGDHLRNGIFGVVSYGNKIDCSKIARKKLYVYNVQPTVMHYFGMASKNDKRYGPVF